MDIDNYDLRILRSLEGDSRLSLSQIAKQTNLSKTQVKYRIDKLIKDDVIKIFYTLFNINKLGLIAYSIYLKIDQSFLDDKENLYKDIKSLDNIVFIQFCEGYYDVRCMVIVKSLYEFETILLQLYEKFGQTIVEDRMFPISQINFHRELSDDKNNTNLYTLREESLNGLLDKYSNGFVETIFSTLNINSRVSAVELTQKTGSTLRSVLYFLKKIKNERYVLGHSILLNTEKIGLSNFIIDISVKKQSAFDEIISFFISNNVLRYSYKQVGIYNLSLDIIVESNLQFQDILKNFKSLFAQAYYEISISLVSETIFSGWYNKL
ncbi:MAG: Lrp/AsnC family transcriptional regulator [Nanoarchaeota archaeon]